MAPHVAGLEELVPLSSTADAIAGPKSQQRRRPTFLSHRHRYQPCCARRLQRLSQTPPPARAGSLLGPSSLARTMRKSFPITSSPETYVSSGLDSLFCLSDNSCAHPLQQVGSLPKNDVDVGTGLVGAPAYVSCSPFVSLSASSADPYVPSVGAAMS